MAFDFQSAIAAANAVVERQENQGGTNYTYPLVYPQAGQTIVIRPLFNPKSGQIVRLVNRHEKVPCYRTYGIDCPICQVQQQVKDITGQDPFGRNKSSRSRGICFAQYISSTAQIDKGGNRGVLQPGEVILFMFPWSVYTQFNATIQAISQTPTGMDQAFCHAQSGLFLQITVTPDFKYTTTNVPYMTFPTQQTDDQFMKMLEDMENLAEQVVPSTITQEVDKQVREYADAIYRQYINPQVPNQQPQVPNQPTTFSSPPPQPVQQPQVPAQQFAPQQPQFTGYPPMNTPTSTGVPVQNPINTFSTTSAPQVPGATISTNTTNSRPPCFGNHQENSPQCICCPDEVLCLEANK